MMKKNKQPFQPLDIHGYITNLKETHPTFGSVFNLTVQVYLLVSVPTRKLTKYNERLQMLSCGQGTVCGRPLLTSCGSHPLAADDG